MIRLMKKFFALSTFLSALTFAAIATTSAKAETFATKACDPIQVVIHASYGGGTDTTARMMSIRSRRTLKADMQIVGKRGGSGAKAQNYTLTRPKDGCTIMALTESHLYTMARGKSDMKIDDLVGVARAMEEPTFIVVNAKNKELSTIKKFIKFILYIIIEGIFFLLISKDIVQDFETANIDFFKI